MLKAGQILQAYAHRSFYFGAGGSLPLRGYVLASLRAYAATPSQAHPQNTTLPLNTYIQIYDILGLIMTNMSLNLGF